MGAFSEIDISIQEICSACDNKDCYNCTMRVNYKSYVANIDGATKHIISIEPIRIGQKRKMTFREKVMHKVSKLFTIGFLLLSMSSMSYARDIDTIIVHHTGSNNRDISAGDIDRYHRLKGWTEIGYHYVIRRNGSVETGRSVERIGAHDYGNNRTSIGICLSGNTATQNQIKSLCVLLKELVEIHNIKKIWRHHDKCPGPSINISAIAKRILSR